ncbi:MAG: DUF3179 domain-containing protein [Proteobacteria bacterium]|nr:DUF3179 domain-containing protein [Pseudomonadota bacterium]
MINTHYMSLFRLALMLGLLVQVCGSPAWAQDGLSESAIGELARVTVGDDQLRDKPPAVDRPEFIPVTDAALFLDPNEVVFVEESPGGGGEAIIYPQSILVMHEVLNISEQGRRRCVTYSPLTGSVAGYLAKAGPHSTTFGTMGLLINSNRVVYDRATMSWWPQLLGIAIKGPLKGQRLERFPLLWTRWKLASKKYPQAQVLSRRTGHRVRYGKDRYGSYAKAGTYYDTGGSYYPLSHVDTSLHPKERILGLAEGEVSLALIEAEIKRQGVASVEFGLSPVVAIYDQSLDAVRVFSAVADGRNLHFETAGSAIVDIETRSHWNVMGQSTEGRLRGMTLERVAAMDCMWFAWKAFYPYTNVWGRQGNDGTLF